MDIKHNLWSNHLRPAYLERPRQLIENPSELKWEQRQGGLVTIGFDVDTFAFDNERPKHKVWLEPYRLSYRLVTNAEYQGFMEDGGY